MNPILARISAFLVVTAPFQGLFRPLSRHPGRRTSEQVFQSPHIVDQIHQANSGCSSHLALDPDPEPASMEHMLVTKDVFHPSPNLGTGTVGPLFLWVQLPVSVSFMVDPAPVSFFLEFRLPLLRATGRAGPDGTATVLLVEHFVKDPAIVD